MDDSQLEGWRVMLERNVSHPFTSASCGAFSTFEAKAYGDSLIKKLYLVDIKSSLLNTRSICPKEVKVAEEKARPKSPAGRARKALRGVVRERHPEVVEVVVVVDEGQEDAVVVEVVVEKVVGVVEVEVVEEVGERAKEVEGIRTRPGRGDMIRKCQEWALGFRSMVLRSSPSGMPDSTVVHDAVDQRHTLHTSNNALHSSSATCIHHQSPLHIMGESRQPGGRHELSLQDEGSDLFDICYLLHAK